MKFTKLAIVALLAVSSTQAIKIHDKNEEATDDIDGDNAAGEAALAAVDEQETMAANEDTSSTETEDPKVGINFLVNGSGSPCVAGQQAAVQYTGALTSNGNVFDSSIPRGEPIKFEVGTGRVIKCWQ